MAHMRTVRQQLLLELGEDVVWRGRILGQRLGEEFVQRPRFDVGKYALCLDVFKVVGQQVHHFMPQITEFVGVHPLSP
jgi:hypothetical protein